MEYIVQLNENEKSEVIPINMYLINRKTNTYVTSNIYEGDISILKLLKEQNIVKLYYPNFSIEAKSNTTPLRHQYQKFHYVAKTESILNCKKINNNGDDIVVAIIEPGFNLDHNEFNLWKNSPDVTTNNNIDVEYTWYTDNDNTDNTHGTTYDPALNIEDPTLNISYDDVDTYGIRISGTGKPTIYGIDNPSSWRYANEHSTQVASVIGAFADRSIPLTSDVISGDIINATEGLYNGISVTGGSGSGLTLNVLIKNIHDVNYISSIKVNNNGSNYVIGDVITISGSSIGNLTDITITITSKFVDMINGNGDVENGVPVSLENGVTGICPGVKILPVSISLTNFKIDHFILAMGYLTDLRNEYNNDNTKGANIVAVNMSFGMYTSDFTSVLQSKGVTNASERKQILEHIFTDVIDKAGEVGILSVSGMDNVTNASQRGSNTTTPIDYADDVFYLPGCLYRSVPETDAQLAVLSANGQPKSSKYMISTVDVSTVYASNVSYDENTNNTITNGAVRSDYSAIRSCIAGDGAIYRWPKKSGSGANNTYITSSTYQYGTSFVTPQVTGTIASMYGMISPALLSHENGISKTPSELALFIKNKLINSVSKSFDTTTSVSSLNHYTVCYGTASLDDICFSQGLLNSKRAVESVTSFIPSINQNPDGNTTIVLLTHGNENDDYWEDIVNTMTSTNTFNLKTLTDKTISESTSYINSYLNGTGDFEIGSDDVYGLVTTACTENSALSLAIRNFADVKPVVVFDAVAENDISGALNFTGANQSELCESLIKTVDNEVKEASSLSGNQNYLFIAFNPNEDTEWNFGTEARIKFFNQKTTTTNYSSLLSNSSVFDPLWPETLQTISFTDTNNQSVTITPYLITLNNDHIQDTNNPNSGDIEATLNAIITEYSENSSLYIGNGTVNSPSVTNGNYTIVSLSMSSNYVNNGNTHNTALYAKNAIYNSSNQPMGYAVSYDNTNNTRTLVGSDDRFVACIGISSNDLAASVITSMNNHYLSLNDPTLNLDNTIITTISQTEHTLAEGETDAHGIDVNTDSTSSTGPQTGGTEAYIKNKRPELIQDKGLYKGPLGTDNRSFTTRVLDIKRDPSTRPIHIALIVHVPETLFTLENRYWYYWLTGFKTAAANYSYVLDIKFSEDNSDTHYNNNITETSELKLENGEYKYDILIADMVYPNSSNTLRELSKTRTVFIHNMDSTGAPNVVHSIANDNYKSSVERSKLFQNSLASNFLPEASYGPRQFAFIAYVYLNDKPDFENRKKGLLTVSSDYPTNNLIDEFFYKRDVITWELTREHSTNANFSVGDNVLVTVSEYGLPATITELDNTNVTVQYYKDSTITTYNLSEINMHNVNSYKISQSVFSDKIKQYINNQSSSVSNTSAVTEAGVSASNTILTKINNNNYSSLDNETVTISGTDLTFNLGVIADSVSDELLTELGLQQVSWRLLLEEKNKYYSQQTNFAVINSPVGSNFDMANLCLSFVTYYGTYMTDTRTDPSVRSNASKYQGYTNILGRKVDEEGTLMMKVIDNFIKNNAGSNITYYSGTVDSKPEYIYPSKLNITPSSAVGYVFDYTNMLGMMCSYNITLGNSSIVTSLQTITQSTEVNTTYSIPFGDLYYEYDRNNKLSGNYARRTSDNEIFGWKDVNTNVSEETRYNGVTEYRYKIQIRWYAPISIHPQLVQLLQNDGNVIFTPTNVAYIDGGSGLEYITFENYTPWTTEQYNLNPTQTSQLQLKRNFQTFLMKKNKTNLSSFTTKRQRSKQSKNYKMFKFN